MKDVLKYLLYIIIFLMGCYFLLLLFGVFIDWYLQGKK